MKKTIILALALALVGGAAYANFCARDNVPAASLLVPYAVVDMTATGTPDPSGYSTLLAVTNVSSARQLIHVTVWNAASTHVVDWDEMLSGYDVWSINLRDVVTADFQNFDTSSNWPSPQALAPQPWGPTTNSTSAGSKVILTQPATTGNAPNGVVYNCGYPYGTRVKAYQNYIVTSLQAPLINYSQDVPCNFTSASYSPAWLSNVSPTRLFFYVTVDATYTCSAWFPDDSSFYTDAQPGYAPATGYLKPANVLTGEIFYMNPSQNYSESIPAVALESAMGTSPASYDYYSRYATPAGGTSDREPLGTAFAFNYFNAGGASSEVRVWKQGNDIDPVTKTSVKNCQTFAYYAFDENENSQSRNPGGGLPSPNFQSGEANALPLEAQSVPLTTGNFDGLMGGNGWMLLVFDPSIYGPTGQTTMAWVGVKTNFQGYSTMVEATTLANAFCDATQVLPQLGVRSSAITYH